MTVYALEVVLLTTRAGNSKTEFKVYAESGKGQDATWIRSEYDQTVT